MALTVLAVLSKTISDEQVSLNRQLHQDDSNYGNRSDGSGVAGNLPVALSVCLRWVLPNLY